MPEQRKRGQRRPRWTFEDVMRETATAIQALALARGSGAQWIIEDLLEKCHESLRGSYEQWASTQADVTPAPLFAGTAEEDRTRTAQACIRYAPLQGGLAFIKQGLRDYASRAQQRVQQPGPGEEKVMQRNESERAELEEARATEAAYRRGWTQATEETARLVLQLVELGYKPTEIKRLLAVYDDHYISPWRQAGDLDKREAPPPFDINQCQEILAGTTGYDWIV